MHDHAAVTALIDHVMAGDVPPADIAEIRIRAASSLSPEALEQAYEMLVLETPLRGSRLVVVSSSERRACSSCGGSWSVTPDDMAGHLVVCPSCGAPSRIENGADIQVLEISTSGGGCGPSAPRC